MDVRCLLTRARRLKGDALGAWAGCGDQRHAAGWSVELVLICPISSQSDVHDGEV